MPKADTIEFDYRALPVSLALHTGVPTMRDVAFLREQYTHLHAMGNRFVDIHDLQVTKMPSAKVRKALADVTRDFGPGAKRLTIVSIMVVGSPIVRAVLEAHAWLQPPPMPQVNVATMDQAIETALEWLLKDNLSLPEYAIAALDEHRLRSQSA